MKQNPDAIFFETDFSKYNMLMYWQFFETIVSAYNISFFIIVGAALGIIFSFNPVYSVIFLIICFLGTSFLFLLLQVEFLALILVIVYLGAVCVLFLFIIMMLNIKILELRREINFTPFLVFIVSLFFIFLLDNLDEDCFAVSLENSFGFLTQTFDISFFFQQIHFNKTDVFFSNLEVTNSLTMDSLKKIGFVLYTFFSLQFIVASFVLLVAMLGAIFLTLEITSKSKKQDIFSQLTKNKGII